MTVPCSHVGKGILLSHRALQHSAFSDPRDLAASVHILGRDTLAELCYASSIAWISSSPQVGQRIYSPRHLDHLFLQLILALGYMGKM